MDFIRMIFTFLGTTFSDLISLWGDTNGFGDLLGNLILTILMIIISFFFLLFKIIFYNWFTIIISVILFSFIQIVDNKERILEAKEQEKRKYKEEVDAEAKRQNDIEDRRKELLSK